MEHQGRQRHHRYYTVAAYRSAFPQDSRYEDIDLSLCGGFAPIDEASFYSEEAALHQYVDKLKLPTLSTPTVTKPRKVYKNPLLPDGTVKKGRPRKNPEGTSHNQKRVPKRKRGKSALWDQDEVGDVQEDQGAPIAKKQRVGALEPVSGAEDKTVPDTEATNIEASTSALSSSNIESPQLPLRAKIISKRRPGRPPRDATSGTQGTVRCSLSGNQQNSSLQIAAPPSIIYIPDTLPGGSAATFGDIVDHVDTPLTPLTPLSPLTPLGSDYSPLSGSHPVVSTTAAEVANSVGSVGVELCASTRPDDIMDKSLGPTESQLPAALPPSSLDLHASVTESLLSQLPDTLIRMQGFENVPIDPILRTMDIEVAQRDPATYPPVSCARRQCEKLTDIISTEEEPASQLQSEPAPPIPAASFLGKRQEPDTTTNSQDEPSKRAKNQASAKRGMTNISHLLRETEFLQLLQNYGGIMTTNGKEFQTAHAELLEKMFAAKQQTSAPFGVRPDRRTIEATFSKLESQGKVKIVKSSLRTMTGVQRPAVVTYLPSVEQERLTSYLTNLASSPLHLEIPAVKRIEDSISYGRENHTQRNTLPTKRSNADHPKDGKRQSEDELATPENLLNRDDHTVRDALLAEQNTLAQSYGFIVAKASRARQLHLLSASSFELERTPQWIISKEQRILQLSFYQQDISISDYCTLVSVPVHSEDLQHLLNDPNGKRRLLRDLPKALHDSMQVGKARARSRILDALEVLRSLKLVVPLQISASATPWIICAPNGDFPTAFDPAPLEGWTTHTPSHAPVYWRFNPLAPIHLWVLSNSSPPFWKDVSVRSRTECEAYWKELRLASLNHDYAQAIKCPVSNSTTGPLQTSAEGIACLRRQASWRTGYIFTLNQEQYLKQHLSPTSGTLSSNDSNDAEALLTRICSVVSAPRNAVTEFLAKAQAKHEAELEKARRRIGKGKQDAKGARAKRSAADKALLAHKASESKEQRQREWEQLVSRLCPQPTEPALALRLVRLRAKYLLSASGTDTDRWEAAVKDEMKEAEMAQQTLLQQPSSTGRPAFQSAPVALPQVATNAPEKSVQALVEEQGPPLSPKATTKKKGKGRKAAENSSEGMFLVKYHVGAILTIDRS